jgi:protein-tyrosine phosphatase
MAVKAGGMNHRVLNLHGIHNFRDYGGYHARDNAKLVSSRLFRSGQHVDATSDDLDAVAAVNLTTIVDLRGDSERATYPCARHDGFSAEVLFAAGETSEGGQAPHIAAARNVRTAADAHRAMVSLYEAMPYRPKLVEVFRLYFDALANRNGASLIHCLAGKDRTGIAVGLLHSLLGVHSDDVMTDFMLTNTAGDPERRIAAGAATVRRNFGAGMDDGALRTIMSVHPEFLQTAFSTIVQNHGSIASYADSILGVGTDHIDVIEQQLLI